MTRRSLLKAGAAFAASTPLLRTSASERSAQGPSRKPAVVVVGAGVFGGWTALYLQRRGARVTLVDTWGPGNSRASSGGETRVIRGTHGPERPYMELVRRALELWKENQARWNRTLFRPIGLLWMPGEDDRYEKGALPLLREYGFAHEELSAAEAGKRFPHVNFEDVPWAIHEKETGYLLARRSCQAVLEAFQSEGGDYRQLALTPGAIRGGVLSGARLADGSTLTAEQYVFACGPWLGRLFPDVLGSLIKPTRQEVFFFGPPLDDSRFHEDRTPVWIDNGKRLFYGIPGSEWRGFKVADDTLGPDFDPTSGERAPTPEGIEAARRYLEHRFPGLKGAPLVESRVCQYEKSPDGHFIVDRHPQAENVVLVGGGSGRGFKHGPALGEWVAGLVLGDRKIDPFFSLSRFSR
jgi:glycine/D-amino acid oxidase-like deaminating enzyme